jgi:hypothetical protein
MVVHDTGIPDDMQHAHEKYILISPGLRFLRPFSTLQVLWKRLPSGFKQQKAVFESTSIVLLDMTGPRTAAASDFTLASQLPHIRQFIFDGRYVLFVGW